MFVLYLCVPVALDDAGLLSLFSLRSAAVHAEAVDSGVGGCRADD